MMLARAIQLPPDFLPGRLILRSGSSADYHRLARFHYRPKPPASFAEVLRIDYHSIDPRAPSQLIAVGVLSYPTLNNDVRDQILKLTRFDPARRHAFVNRHIRTISRVIIHPTFRSLGLATTLVRALIERCPTRYVEALAIMARAHPFFRLAGMREFSPTDTSKPVYYLLDRGCRTP